MIYRGFPSKLHHDVPPWVDPNSLFHIRIRLDRDKEQTPLTDALLATTLLKSAEFYDSKFRWHIALFLLMPDHVHALLAFQRDRSMSRVIGDWKHFTLERIGSNGRRAFSIIDCAMTSAGSNCKPRSITSGKILS
jgi:putative transposase